jgi:GntR family transcriptional regulator
MAEPLPILVSEHDDIPIYLQIAHQITYLIYSQYLRDGERLPTVRALASHVQVNPNTVTQAYLELQRTGLVTARRGQGTFVRASAGTRDQHWALRHEQLLHELRRSRARAHALGFSDTELRAHLYGLLQSGPERCETAFIAPGRSAQKYARTLSEALSVVDVTVTPLGLELVQLGDPAARDVLERVFYVIAPVTMRNQLEELLSFEASKHAVLGIALEITKEAIERVAALPEDVHVCVFTSPRYLAIALNILHTYGSAPFTGVTRVLDTSTPETIRGAVEAADIVVYTFGVSEAVADLGVPPEKRLELEFQTSPESVRQLRDVFSSHQTFATSQAS